MRKRSEIESDGKKIDLLKLEVLLDIRELLEAQAKNKPKTEPNKKPGRPKKIKS